MKPMKVSMISSIQERLNKGPEIPSTPAPAAQTPAPTIDNSEEVKKQRLLEEQRQMKARGLAATDNTGGEGVPLAQENVDKPKATQTLLGA